MVKAIQVVDKAAAKGAIHKNAANRKKTQIARKMQAIS
jgi:small subunit ribosomal protein S20